MTHATSSHANDDSASLNSVDVAELEARLREAEETLDAIRRGDVDAVVVGGPDGQQVYTLENADRPYRVLIEQMQEGALTLSDEGIVLYCNERFASIVGTPRGSIIGEGMSRFFQGSEAEAFTGLIGCGPVEGASSEFTLVGAEGHRVPVNISLVDLRVDEGATRVICGVVTDLTHNRRRSQELAAANERLASQIEERKRAEESLQLALDASDMGSWDIDLKTQAARRSLRHDQIFGHDHLLPSWSLERALEQIVPEDHEAVRSAFAWAMTSGQLEFEARMRRAGDGTMRWLNVKGRTKYEGAEPVRVTGVVADVTERRAIEEQLRQAQKMEAVGQLTGGIAHDFNNLLMIIGGSLDMLARRVPSDERTARLFTAARQGVARGAKLNQQLLAFARRQDLRVEAVYVDDLIPNFENLLDRAVGEIVAVRIEKAPDLWFCRTDPHQLETAILNLAINARDAMPEGGTLTVATGNRTVSDQLAARWGASGGEYVVVSVADTGTGMAPDVIARVFEPFFTTKEVGKGTGLGLSQVYGFTKQSDGFVTIESEVGRGTTVRVHLPRTHEPRAERRHDHPEAVPVGVARGIVLVVEDDADVRAVTGGMLRDLGYEVREAETARAALALIESGEHVDLVFSDVIMPCGMSGIELATEIRFRRPGLPVLLTSGYTAQRIIPEALANELSLLRKPYTQSELLEAIREKVNGGSRIDTNRSLSNGS